MITVTSTSILYPPNRRAHPLTNPTIIDGPHPWQMANESKFSIMVPSVFSDANWQFAFMIVRGAATGSEFFTTAGIKEIQIGNIDVDILIVYVATPYGNLFVDAINADNGFYVDEDFVEVYSEGILDTVKTDTANKLGELSNDAVQDIRACSKLSGTPFLEWIKVGNSSPFNNPDYNTKPGETGFLFALYRTPWSKINLSKIRRTPVYVAPGVAVEYGGSFGTQNALIEKLVGTVAILSIGSTMEDPLKNEAIDLAVKNLNSIAEKIKQGVIARTN